MKRRMLDLFCGRLGWSKAFLARGWEVTAVDLVEPPEIPEGVIFIQIDVTKLPSRFVEQFDFGCASSPCEKFSVWGMRHFHPDPPYPTEGIELFEHTRKRFTDAGIHYVMENVRAAQSFVGQSVNHVGPFHLWGNAVPPLLPNGISKGFGAWDRKYILTTGSSKSNRRKELKAIWAEIPPELSHTVATYAERILTHD